MIQFGEEVKFPVLYVLFEFGSYARDNNDTADTTWDNLKIETIRKSTVVFSDDFASNTIDPQISADAPSLRVAWATFTPSPATGHAFYRIQPNGGGRAPHSVLCLPLRLRTSPGGAFHRPRRRGRLRSASRSALWILDETKTK